jgi:site-specific recombinase XerD
VLYSHKVNFPAAEGEVNMRRWDRLVEVYLAGYQVRGWAEGTLDKTQRELDRWGTWLKHRHPKPALEKIGSELILQYLRERTAFRAKATVSGTMSILRGMGEYLVREGYWGQNPLRWIQGPKLDWRCHLPRRINQEALSRIMETAGRYRQPYQKELWLTIISLLYGTGMRRGELERLNLTDWNRGEGLLTIDGRKTGQERRLALPELSRRCLESYLVQRHNRLEQVHRLHEPALLVTKNGTRLKKTALSQAIHRLTAQAGLGRITLHQFRHTCASDMLESGLPVVHVQSYLGHQAIGSTVRYLQIADRQRHEAVQRHPINDMILRAGVL